MAPRLVYNQELTVEAAISGNYELASKAFVNDPLVNIWHFEARKLFDEMLKNTAKYCRTCSKNQSPISIGLC